jgi:hypothetical protein
MYVFASYCRAWSFAVDQSTRTADKSRVEFAPLLENFTFPMQEWRMHGVSRSKRSHGE